MKTTLNRQQCIVSKGIASSDAHALVLAVAGAGKTTMLAHLAKRLLRDSSGILFLNATKKAGREIRSTLANEEVMLGKVAIRTFHSLAFELLLESRGETAKLLRSAHFHSGAYQIPERVKALDPSDCIQWLQNISVRLGYTFKDTELAELWETHSKRFVTGENTVNFYVSTRIQWRGTSLRMQLQQQQEEKKKVKALLCAFEEERFARGAFCYYDTPVLAAALLRNRSLAARYSKKFPILCQDEFQDVSSFQFDMAVALAGAGSRLLMVGDPRQCINRFMGADGRLLKGLKKALWQKVTIYQMNRSERLSPLIGKAVRGIERQMKFPGLAKIIGVNCTVANIKPRHIECTTLSRMIRYLARAIEMEAKRVPAHEILINYKDANANGKKTRQLVLLQKELRRRGIGYLQIPMPKTERRLLGSFIAALRSANALSDAACFAEVLRIARSRVEDAEKCATKVLKQGIQSMEGHSHYNEIKSIHDILRLAGRENSLKGQAQVLLGGAASFLPKNHARRLNAALAKAILAWLSQYTDLASALEDYEEDIEYHLMKTAKDLVILSTIHSSKCSGYRTVFMLNVSKRAFSNKMKNSKKNSKEMLNLLYVGMTRAKEKLVMLYPGNYQQSPFLQPLVKRGLIKFIKVRSKQVRNADWSESLPSP